MEQNKPKQNQHTNKGMIVLAGILGGLCIIALAALIIFSLRSQLFKGSEITTPSVSEFKENSQEYFAGLDQMTGMDSLEAGTGKLATIKESETKESETKESETKESETTKSVDSESTKDENKGTKEEAGYGDFIFADSNTVLLNEQELSANLLSAVDCQRALNEIYARHGFNFHEKENPADYAYFNSIEWYKEMPKIDDMAAVTSKFSNIEIDNVAAIVAYRDSHNW